VAICIKAHYLAIQNRIGDAHPTNSLTQNLKPFEGIATARDQLAFATLNISKSPEAVMLLTRTATRDRQTAGHEATTASDSGGLTLVWGSMYLMQIFVFEIYPSERLDKRDRKRGC
jgi:hypothetical protein